MRAWFRTGRGVGLFSLVVIALLIVGVAPYVKQNLLSDQGPVERATPTAVREASQEKADDAAAERAALREALLTAKAEAAKKAVAAKEAPEEAPEEPVVGTLAEPVVGQSVQDQVAQRGLNTASAPATASASAAQGAVPSDSTMYLSIPSIGLSNIPVFEGTSEAVLSQGVGHVPGTGYPWVPGSNTYIAGHRLGYPGTVSDHIFWNLPSIAVGDQVILTDSLGQSYTYQVSEIFEVYPTDLSVTGATGGDVVSLQTCIENFGDYWTPGPNWFVRYIVRANRVG